MKRESFALLISAATASLMLGLACTATHAGEGDEVFATVGDDRITRAEFEREVYAEARQTYYHGRPRQKNSSNFARASPTG